MYWIIKTKNRTEAFKTSLQDLYSCRLCLGTELRIEGFLSSPENLLMAPQGSQHSFRETNCYTPKSARKQLQVYPGNFHTIWPSKLHRPAAPLPSPSVNINNNVLSISFRCFCQYMYFFFKRSQYLFIFSLATNVYCC